MRALQTLELGEQRPEGMAAVQLVGAVGEQHEQTLVTQAAGQKGDEGARGSVGPVHVLEDQHDQRRLPGEIEQLEHRLEQPHLARGILPGVGGRLVLEARQQRGQLRPAAWSQRRQGRMALAHERAQGAQQWRVGQLAVRGLDALTAQDEHLVGPVVQRGLKLGNQPGLADPGITAEQREGGPTAGGFPRGVTELGQFADPAHETAAGQSRPHGRSIAGRRTWCGPNGRAGDCRGGLRQR